ncbi:MAG TPA: carboxypeptidase-like regulatory domain-containing protein [Myxococcota bacterium]|nr:carboxypeptidase-like regulatory domain-containing protein [Myxococcota bacterium]
MAATDAAGNTGSASVTVELATGPPLAITISTPLNGEILVEDSADVAGTLSDARATVRVNGVTATVVGGQYVARQVPVQEGANTFTATATRGTETASAAADVFYNRPPAVLIRTPSPGMELRVATIDVEGTVDDPAAFVDVNGVAAAVDSGGRFVARDVPLTPGANTLTARAIDVYGAQGMDAVDVTRDDAAAPHLRVVSLYSVPFVPGTATAFSDLDEYDRALAFGDPLAGGVFLPPSLPVARGDLVPATNVPVASLPEDTIVLSDLADPIMVELFADSGAVPIETEVLTPEPFESWQPGPSEFVPRDAFEPESFDPAYVAQTFLPVCQPDSSCPDGFDRAARITVRASVGGGQDDLVFDTEPPEFSTNALVITSPDSGSTIAGNAITVAGYVGAKLPVLDTARFSVFDTFGVKIGEGLVPLVAEVDPSDTDHPIKARFVIPDVLLGGGFHTIDVEAWSATGQPIVGGVFVNVDPDAPGVALVSPQDGTATLDPAAVVTLNFAADTTLDAVNGTPDGRAFSAGIATDALTIPLALGPNTLRIDYTTAAGSFTQTFTIYRYAQVSPPRIASPMDGSYYSTDTVIVRGTIDFGTPYVEVNGVPATIGADGVSFTATIPVPRATGVLFVSATRVELLPYTVNAISLPFGSVASIQITPDFDPLPFVVTPPDGTNTTDSSVVISGEVLEPMLMRLTTPTETLEVDARTTSRFEFPAVDLAPGVNQLIVRGFDRAGNLQTEVLNIQRVDSALALVSPAAGATLPGFAVDLSLTAFVDLSLEAVFAQNRLISGIASPSAPVPIAAGAVNLPNIPLEPGPNDLRIVYRRGSGPQEVLAFTLNSTTSANTFVTGRVIEASSGSPIVGATVRVDAGGAVQSVFTNNDGIYFAPAAPGTVRGSAEAAGYGHGFFTEQAVFGTTSQVADLALGSPSAPISVDVLYTLTSPGFTRLFGIVRDASGGLGIGGASVSLIVNGFPWSVTTEPSGAYQLDLPPGSFSGTIHAEGYNEASFSGSLPYENTVYLDDARLARIPNATANVVARVPSGPTLTGRVLDAGNQASVSRANVVIDVGGQAEQGFSNPEGVYLLPVTTGALTGTIAASGYTGATLSGTTTSGQTRMADALLTTSGPAVAVGTSGAPLTAAVVVGHVTDSQTGAGISGALVTIVVNGQTLIGLSDANGDFRFEVEPGSVTGTIVATGYGTSTFTVTVAGGDTVNVNVASNPPVLPPTGLPGLMNEVEILVPPPGTVTDWEKVTVVGTVLRPSSQVTVNGVAATVVGNRFTARHIDLAMGANTITATATNVGSPAAAETISVDRSDTPVLAVTIYSPPDGATVPGSGLVVRGFVSARNSATSAAGTYVGVDEGVFDLLDQPVSVDDANIAVVATIRGSTEEASDRSSILVSSGEPALILNAAPASGEVPFTTTLNAFLGVPAFPIDRIDFDTDGDGAVDVVGATAPQAPATFTAPRLARPRVFATTNQGVELSGSTRINSHSSSVIHREFAVGNPVDLAAGPNGALYVLDGAAATISLYDRSGALVQTFGASGAGNGQMSRPSGLAVAPNGDIYVADTGNDRVQVFSSTGAHLSTLGSSGSAVGQFRSPSAIAVDEDQLVVADPGNGRLQILNLDGTPTRFPEVPILDARGLTDGSGLGILVSSPSRGLFGLADVLRPTGFGEAAPSDLPSAPVDTARDGSGLWVADGDEPALLLFDEHLSFSQRVAVPSIPVAVLESPRRDAYAAFVADGTRVIEVSAALPSPLAIANELKALLAADQVDQALGLINPIQRDTFRGLYTDVGAALPAHAALMSNFRLDLVRPDRAIVRFDAPSTANGQSVVKSFPIYLTREEDGSWSIVDY